MSGEIFAYVPRWWKENSVASAPAFFYRTAEEWKQAPAADLQSFQEQVQSRRPFATVLLTSYAVGSRTMLVAHYESANEACHQVWSVQPDGSLAGVYRSPVESTDFAKAA
ncbi:MAG TPA: hypothetical protein VLJ39_22215 [Tepidisphaeraceae bacterium]|nr:hypothetical protein [Tepidisphaeraceae bacterium]